MVFSELLQGRWVTEILTTISEEKDIRRHHMSLYEPEHHRELKSSKWSH